jgi:glycosyltransferase involved in cell wall biosynthesis
LSISVIIPTYNRLNLLKETIHNVLNQTLRPDEIIVVDTGSSDGTVTFLKDRYKNQIQIVNCLKKSPGAARNLGLSIASCKYIQYLDSDDVMTINKLKSQKDKINKTNMGLVYGPYVHVTKNIYQQTWEQKDVIIQYKPIPASMTLHKCMVRGFFTIVPSFLFEKDFLKEVGPWNEEMIAYEDWDYLWRIGNICSNPPHTNDCCYFYRIHGNQTTQNHYQDKERDIQKVVIFNQLYHKYVKNTTNLSKIEKLYFRSLLTYSVTKILNPSDVDVPFNLYNSSIIKNIMNYRNIISKFNRIWTNSDWQIMHGINKSKKEFNKYRALIK